MSSRRARPPKAAKSDKPSESGKTTEYAVSEGPSNAVGREVFQLMRRLRQEQGEAHSGNIFCGALIAALNYEFSYGLQKNQTEKTLAWLRGCTRDVIQLDEHGAPIKNSATA